MTPCNWRLLCLEGSVGREARPSGGVCLLLRGKGKKIRVRLATIVTL